jgi:hypothetical protein
MAMQASNRTDPMWAWLGIHASASGNQRITSDKVVEIFNAVTDTATFLFMDMFCHPLCKVARHMHVPELHVIHFPFLSCLLDKERLPSAPSLKGMVASCEQSENVVRQN